MEGRIKLFLYSISTQLPPLQSILFHPVPSCRLALSSRDSEVAREWSCGKCGDGVKK